MKLLDKLKEKVDFAETILRTNLYKSLGGFSVGGGVIGYLIRFFTG